MLRFFGEDRALPEADRLLIVNLGADVHLKPAPEPLLAPPVECQWEVVWSSEDPRYGGTGTPPLETTENWLIPGHAAVILKPGIRTGMSQALLTHPEVNESEEG